MKTALVSLVFLAFSAVSAAQANELNTWTELLEVCRSDKDSDQAVCRAYFKGAKDMSTYTGYTAVGPIFCIPSNATVNDLIQNFLVWVNKFEKHPEIDVGFSVIASITDSYPC